MTSWVQYFVKRDSAGAIHEFSRIRRTETGMYSEYFKAGAWHTDNSLMEYMFDRDPRDEVSEEVAAEVARSLGGSLE